MAVVKFHRQFLIDLVDTGDAQLPARVMKKLFTSAGDFRADRADHPYRGIASGWIRVVSRGTTAYRVIYLRDGDAITLYRAGPHSIEDNLAAPGSTEEFPVISEEVGEVSMRPLGSNAAAADLVQNRISAEESTASRFMKNHESRRLFEQVLGRRLIPHKEAIFVSPYLSLDLLKPTQPLGQMLDEWIADGCSVTLITRPPSSPELAEFTELERRGLSLLYVQRLHAKVYVFRVDESKLNDYQRSNKDLMLIGSANLTASGFNPDGIRTREPQLELSYQVAQDDNEELEYFMSYLAGVGISHEVVRHNLSEIGARS